MSTTLNPSIALSGQVPQIQGPLDQYKEGLSVQTMLNQQALQKQQQQQNAIAQQSQQLELQQQQRQEQDTQKFNKAFTDAGGDWNQTIKNATDAGASGQFLIKAQLARSQQVAQLATATKDQLANESAKHEALGVSAQKVLAADPDDQAAVYAKERNAHLLSGAYSASDIPEQMPPVDQLQQTANASKAARDIYKDAQDLKDKQATAQKTAAEVPGAVAESAIKQQDAQLTPQERAGLKAPGTLEDRRYETIVANQKQGIPVAPPDLAWKAAYEKRKTLVPTAQINLQQGLLTPQAQSALGQQYVETGALPQGMRSPAMAAQILNTGVKNAGGAPDLAANKATYSADAGSLKKLQSNFDTVDAFEKTAGKNLDIFLNQAKKVTDTGLPVLNMPARLIAGQLGGTDQAAFDAARTTALTEISRVLNSANASGVVSDHARGEVSSLIKPDATLPQIVQAANILKQDMANRHAAYQQQIGEIQNRIKGNPQAPAANAPATHPFFDQFGGTARQ